MFTKYAAPVAALVASVAAQSSCSFTATTVSAANDAVTSCTAISGDVHFVQGAANPMVTLAAKTITGKIIYDSDSTVTGFSAPNLSQVGDMSFTNLSSLSTLSLNALTESGNFEITGCGGLGTVTTGPQYATAGVITVSNTQLQALDAFSTLSMIDGLVVQGNLLLANISMNIGSVKTIDVGNNEVQNDGLSVVFNNLTTANSIIVRNASTVSLSALGSITGSLQLISNTFESFQAPNLTWSGGLNLNSNNKLTNISFPMLTAVNGTNASISITNNTALQTVGGFPQLTQVKGAVTFIGAFNNVTDIKQLKEVDGLMTVSSTQDITGSVCSQVASLYAAQALRAKPKCSGKAANAASASGGVAGSGSDTSSGSTSSAAAGIIDIPALPSLSMGLGAALLQFLLSF